MSDFSLQQLSDKIFELAKEKRWGTEIGEVNVMEKIALIHSEVSECLDAFRKNNIKDKDGVNEELADIMIRVMHLAAIFRVDLESEILKKIDANKSRDWSGKNETYIELQNNVQ